MNRQMRVDWSFNVVKNIFKTLWLGGKFSFHVQSTRNRFRTFSFNLFNNISACWHTDTLHGVCQPSCRVSLHSTFLLTGLCLGAGFWV